jgi:predicted XRE-type DNA-binding protein
MRQIWRTGSLLASRTENGVPRIRRAKLDRFTIDRLMGVLAKLDQQVEVEVRVVERAA